MTYRSIGAFLLAGLALLSSVEASAQQKKDQTLIEAQPLGTALQVLAEEYDLQVLFETAVVANYTAQAIPQGTSCDAALGDLLSGTDLTYEFVNERTVAIREGEEKAVFGDQRGDSDPKNSSPAPVLMAQNQTVQTSERTTTINDGEEPTHDDFEEIVVTGTLLRNANEGASPVLIFDRDSIDQGGFATTQEFVDSLPQHFGGGPNEDSFFQSADLVAARNSTFGTSINLRGLGTSSTLVLINGKRLSAAGGTTGDFVDVSSIPLTAIERVEILTDGASAIYGADAIAGVVNFILRDDYEGAETRLYVGTVTDGNHEELRFGQTFGKSWDRGNVLLSYEYHDRSNLESQDRDFAANSDLSRFGGSNFDGVIGAPANILDPAQGFQPGFSVPPGQDGTALEPDDFLVGVINRNNRRESLDLLPDLERHSIFLSARQSLSKRSEIFGEFQFSRRDFTTISGPPLAQFVFVTPSNPFYVSPIPGAPFMFINYNFGDELGVQIRSGDVENSRGVLGGRFDFGDTWQLEAFGTYNQEQSNTLLQNTVNTARLAEALGTFDLIPEYDPATDGFFNPFSDGGNSPPNTLDFIRGSSEGDIKGEMWTGQIKADGELGEIGGGSVLLAVGAEYRDESFTFSALNDTSTPTPTASMFNTEGDRDVVAVFAELLIPFIGANNELPGIKRLELNVSGRYDDYSDFGSSTNPKIGLVWSTVGGMTFRGTYGTSFRPPKLSDIDEGLQLILERSAVPDPESTTGFSTAIQLAGSNPQLQPEESTAWTIGMQIRPPAIAGFQVDLTYFDIDFEDRISEPSDPFSFVFDPENFGSFFIRDPDDAIVQELQNSPYFLGTPSIRPSEVVLIIDSRIQNFSRTAVSGIDLVGSYSAESTAGLWTFELNGNYLINFENSFQPGAEFVDQVSTVNNPVDLRARAKVSWQRGGWGSTAFINYTDGYRDTLSTPERSVSSWTTVDLQVRYSTAGRTTSDWLDNTVVSLSLSNLFDEDPPFVNNPAGIAYDPNNASPLGRFISLEIRKDW